jgi:hypothetical protein
MTQPHSPVAREPILSQSPIPRYLQHPTWGTPWLTCQLHHHQHTVLCLPFDICTLVLNYCKIWLGNICRFRSLPLGLQILELVRLLGRQSR